MLFSLSFSLPPMALREKISLNSLDMIGMCSHEAFKDFFFFICTLDFGSVLGFERRSHSCLLFCLYCGYLWNAFVIILLIPPPPSGFCRREVGWYLKLCSSTLGKRVICLLAIISSLRNLVAVNFLIAFFLSYWGGLEKSFLTRGVDLNM